MIKLYGSTASRAHRVLWALKELGVRYEHIPTNFMDRSTHTPEFLAINPNGRVPALDDDGLLLCESLSINLYLARKYGGALALTGLTEETLATQWSFWVATEVEKPLLLASANLFLFAEGQRVAEEAELALAKLSRPLKVLEAHLAAQPYLLGDRFTVADLNVATVMDFVPLVGIDVDAYPRVKAWLSKCLERPAAADWKTVKFSIPRPPTALGVLRMFV